MAATLFLVPSLQLGAEEVVVVIRQLKQALVVGLAVAVEPLALVVMLAVQERLGKEILAVRHTIIAVKVMRAEAVVPGKLAEMLLLGLPAMAATVHLLLFLVLLQLMLAAVEAGAKEGQGGLVELVVAEKARMIMEMLSLEPLIQEAAVVAEEM